MIDRWPRVAERELLRTRIFTVRAETRHGPDGAAHEFYVMDSPDWVNVIPLTAAGEVVLVRQPRFGIGRATLEVPGGMVDPGDADPAAAAARELLEETGYAAERVEALGLVHPNPAIQNNVTWSFVARGCRPVAAPRPDGAEDIEVLRRLLADVPALIAAGEITHALVVCGFYHLFAHDGWPR
ncbi:MAG TPA: NUDIX hydrolase [Myxococcota bacterium]|jgi:8-oxo-dGTP pyrophosphatase MutT (NUDIX family)|nr:NUDIX hydrolase [Myxococcota bacterium]